MVAKGVLEAHGKNRRRRGEESGERNAPLPSGHTLAEILNGSNSHLFGWLLEKDGRRELAERVAMGRLDVNDIHVLNLYIIRLSEIIFIFKFPSTSLFSSLLLRTVGYVLA